MPKYKYYRIQGTFKLIEGKNGPTSFLLLVSKLHGEINERINSKGENRKKEYLTEKQAGYICRKVDSGNLINKSTMRQEIDQDTELDKMNDTRVMKIHIEN